MPAVGAYGKQRGVCFLVGVDLLGTWPPAQVEPGQVDVAQIFGAEAEGGEPPPTVTTFGHGEAHGGGEVEFATFLLGAVDKRSCPIHFRRDTPHAYRIKHLPLVREPRGCTHRAGARGCACCHTLAVGTRRAQPPLLNVRAVVAHLHCIHRGSNAAGIKCVTRRELGQRRGHPAGKLERLRVNLHGCGVELRDHHGKLHGIIKQGEVGQ